MRFRPLWLALILIAVLGTCLDAQPVSVSAAISMKDALAQIAAAYQADGGDHIEFNFGASGTLEAQIENGAPVDLFISASNREMNALEKSGSISAGSRTLVARNQLVLIAPADVLHPPASLAALTEKSVTHIAIGQPKVVPAGTYAMQALRSVKIADAVADRLVYAANVRQVLAYVVRGDVDAGIVYSTDALEAGAKVQIMHKIDQGLHDPIEYPAAIVKDSKNAAAAAKFLKYLQGKQAQAIFHSKGFAPPTTQPTTEPAQ